MAQRAPADWLLVAERTAAPDHSAVAAPARVPAMPMAGAGGVGHHVASQRGLQAHDLRANGNGNGNENGSEHSYGLPPFEYKGELINPSSVSGLYNLGPSLSLFKKHQAVSQQQLSRYCKR